MNKKGFISTSIIYSFFLVFILLMIAILMSFTNKRFLIDKINKEADIEPDVKVACKKGDKLNDCLLKAQYEKEKKFVETDVKKVEDYFKKEKGKPDLTQASTGNSQGMYVTDDDYGNTFYYRGAVDNNYVVLGNFVWRVIRINGDNTIRMIYQGKYNNTSSGSKVTGNEFIDIGNNGNISFNINEINTKLLVFYTDKINEYCDSDPCKTKLFCIKDYYKKQCENYKRLFDSTQTSAGSVLLYNTGYMNSSIWEQGTYNDKYANKDSSFIKEKIDDWYMENFNEDLNGYLSYKTIFCGDKNRICKYNVERCSKDIDDTSLDKYYYESYDRIIDKDEATLICNNTGSIYMNTSQYQKGYINRNLSRYSATKEGHNWKADCEGDACLGNHCEGNTCIDAVLKFRDQVDLIDILTDKSKKGFIGRNGDLTYPIALISADELIYSGAAYNENSNSFLKGGSSFWTMTLAYTDEINSWPNVDNQEGTRYFAMNENGKLELINDKTSSAKVRPVINLKADIKYCSGTGTNTDPYIISDKNC